MQILASVAQGLTIDMRRILREQLKSHPLSSQTWVDKMLSSSMEMYNRVSKTLFGERTKGREPRH